jgi:PAN domain
MTRNLPDDRRIWSFGELLYFHLKRFGTRPHIDPDAVSGREWRTQEFCGAFDRRTLTAKTLSNWLNDRKLPRDTVEIADILFGNNPRHEAQRAELKRALERTRAELQRKRKPGQSGDLIDDGAPDAPEEPAVPFAETNRTDDVGRGGSGGLVPWNAPRPGNDIDDIIDLVEIPRGRDQKRFDQPRRRSLVRSGFTLATGLAVVLGLYVATRPSPPETKIAGTPTATPLPVPAAPPLQSSLPAAVDAGTTTLASPPPATPAPRPESQSAKNAEPPRQESATPLTPPPQVPKAPTEEEQRTAEQRRIEERAIAARMAAFDAAKRQREQEAIRLDQEAAAAAQAQRDRESNARLLAGIGFRLQENTTVTGSSIGYVMTATVGDCAVACLKDNCDAFAFYKEGPKNPRDGTRACYRYRKPLSFSAHAYYAAGERLPDAGFAPDAPNANPVQPTMRFAEAAKSTTPSPANADGLVQCPNGPVKVTGFQLVCDKLVVGGSTLGSAQLRHSVSNINECAARCRAVPQCGAFAYKSEAYRDKHDCEIMGPTKNMNSGVGWVSGVR